MKKLLLVVVVIGVCLTIYLLKPRYTDDSALGAIDSISVNGKVMSFDYSDDITNENLIIRLTAKNFEVNSAVSTKGTPVTNAQSWVAVTNASGVDQNVKLVLTTNSPKLIAGVAPFAVYDQVEDKLNFLTQDKQFDRTKESGTKTVQGTPDASSDTFIPAGQTRYFQIAFTSYLLKDETADWYLEVFGDNNGYGHSF